MTDKKYNLLKDNRVIQADNIEELCDEFVVDCKYNIEHKPFVYTLPKNIKEFYKSLGTAEENTIIYGAIWTDKGLIYVAKMNDKGNLELL